MIIPKDATPTRGEPDGFYTPLVTPMEIDRVGAEVAAMRGGLSRRDVGIAVVVAGLGALTLAATTVVGA